MIGKVGFFIPIRQLVSQRYLGCRLSWIPIFPKICMVLANFREAAAFLVYNFNFTHDANNREIDDGEKYSNS